MDVDRVYYQRPGPVAAAAVALPVLAALAVALRVYVRISYRQGLRFDDWCLIPAAVATLAFGIDVLYGVVRGAVGYPTKLPPGVSADEWLFVKDDQITISWVVQWSSAIIFSVDLALIKASFVLFYLRIFSVKSVVKAFLIAVLVLNCLWGLSFVAVFVFDCRLAFWANYQSAAVIAQNCLDTTELILVHSIISFAFDVLIVATPIPLVWQLQLPRSRKLAISAVFLLGAVATAASLIRVVMLVQVSKHAFKSTSDGLLASTQFLYWTLVECGVGIVAACLPTFSVLLNSSFVTGTLSSLRSLFSSRHASSLGSVPGKDSANKTLSHKYRKQSGSITERDEDLESQHRQTRPEQAVRDVELISIDRMSTG